MKTRTLNILNATTLALMLGGLTAISNAQSPTPTPAAKGAVGARPDQKPQRPKDRALVPAWPVATVPDIPAAVIEPVAKAETDARTLFEQAITFLRAQKPDQALPLLREAEKLAPRRTEIHVALGVTLGVMKQLESSAQAFRKAISLDPRSVAAHGGLCQTLAEMGSHIDAAAECREAVRLEPDSSRYAPQLARLYMLDDRSAEAFQLLETLYARSQNDIVVQGSMADLYFYSGEFARAAEIYERMARSWAGAALIYLRLSAVYEYLDRPAEAITAARKYAELVPGSALAHLNLGERLKNAGLFDESIAPLLKATTIDTKLGDAYLLLSESYHAMGDMQNTVQSLKHAYRYLPPSLTIAFRYGSALTQNGKMADAVEPLERAYAMDPDVVEVLMTLGLAYFESNQFDKGIAILTRAERLAPNNQDIKMFLDVARARKDMIGHFDEIAAQVQKNPDDKTWRLELAGAYRFRGMLREAENEHLELIKRSPKDFDPYNQISIFYHDTGQIEKALEYIRKAIELNPHHVLYLTMSNYLASLGRLDEAIVAARRSVEIKDTLYQSRMNLGDLLVKKGNRTEALREFQAAFELASGEADPNFRLAMLYVQMGNKEGAMRHYSILTGIAPNQLKYLERSIRVRFGSIR